MIEEILWNPYDYQREKFVMSCRKHIPYLRNVEEHVLQKLYYQSELVSLESNQTLFDSEDICKQIYIVIHGVLDIVITDGEKLS